MPLIMDIPGRSEIEIHWGNDPANTDGCILVGEPSAVPDFIENSRETFDLVWAQLQGPLERGEVTISIEGSPA